MNIPTPTTWHHFIEALSARYYLLHEKFLMLEPERKVAFDAIQDMPLNSLNSVTLIDRHNSKTCLGQNILAVEFKPLPRLNHLPRPFVIQAPEQLILKLQHPELKIIKELDKRIAPHRNSMDEFPNLQFEYGALKTGFSAAVITNYEYTMSFLIVEDITIKFNIYAKHQEKNPEYLLE